jgi:membrane protein DedA with SNARE-associated domain
MPLLADLFGNLDTLVDAATDGAQQYRFWVPGTVIALEEIGVPLPMPGDVIAVYLGFRLAAGSMTLLEIMPQMLIGILLGSSGLFLVGRRWGRRMLLRYGFIWHLNESRRLRAEHALGRFGFWAVAIGRHLGLRCPMSLFAGAFGLSFVRFAVAVATSTVLWLVGWLAVGSVVGAPAVDAIKRLSYGGVVIALLVYVTVFVAPPAVHVIRSRRTAST